MIVVISLVDTVCAKSTASDLFPIHYRVISSSLRPPMDCGRTSEIFFLWTNFGATLYLFIYANLLYRRALAEKFRKHKIFLLKKEKICGNSRGEGEGGDNNVRQISVKRYRFSDGVADLASKIISIYGNFEL